MKLIYTKWSHVKAFLRTIDEPVSGEFTMRISSVWQKPDPKMGKLRKGRWVWEIQIPIEAIT